MSGVLALVAVPSLASNADSLQRFQGETFSEYSDVNALSAGVTLALNRFTGGAAIANPKEPFVATDVIDDRKLPRRRLIGAGTSGDLTFVEYEHGGRGLHEHFVLFKANGTDAVAVKACSGFLPHEIEKLRKVVGTQSCRWRRTEH
jgi:hypothetical protein